MKFIEFNIRYDAPQNSVMYIRYSLDDNGYATDGVLSLREVQKGWWQGSIEVSASYNHIQYGYELLQGGKSICNEWALTPHRLRFN